MGGRNKKQRAGSAAHAASAATAAARARAAAEAGVAAAVAEAGSRAAPRPPPASKEPRVKQGTGPRGVARPRLRSPEAAVPWAGEVEGPGGRLGGAPADRQSAEGPFPQGPRPAATWGPRRRGERPAERLDGVARRGKRKLLKSLRRGIGQAWL